MSGERMREIAERAVTEASYRRAVGDSLTPAEVDRAWLLARVEELEAALRPFAAAADGITPEMDHPILIASHYGAGTGGRATHWQVHVDAFRAARAALSPDSEP